MKSLKPLQYVYTFLVLACTFTVPAPQPSLTPPPMAATFGALPIDATATASPSETPTRTPTATPLPWTDELLTMYGICFEAALDASGEVFVLRSAEEHIRFYELADNSGLCRRPVERAPFDFGDGERILAGTWSVGTGCTARHDVQDFNIDDDVLTMNVQFITEGDCNYELVRPFWIGAAGVRDVQINMIAHPNENPSP